MQSDAVVISGLGVTSSLGSGKVSFCKNLLKGYSQFSIMRREGRQKESAFIGSELNDLPSSKRFPSAVFRNLSLSTQVATSVLEEAWEEAHLDQLPPEKIGLIVGGSNFQGREWMLLQSKYRDSPHFLPPWYGFAFMDTDLCGFCSEKFNIQGLAYTVGGASASGQLAIIKAVESVLYLGMEACIALGALSDISYFELYALQSLGAMGGLKVNSPDKACRPFDLEREGFIYGENCAAVVVERMNTAEARLIQPYAEMTGWGISMDGHRNPDPSQAGEVRALKKALLSAGLKASDIDYVNPHGTGSILGDETELRALWECGLSEAYINTTKSLTGHGLSAAGAVEIVATLLQMKSKKLHPSLNLDQPLDQRFNWVKNSNVSHEMVNAISLSYGFGGINTAVCLRNIEK